MPDYYVEFADGYRFRIPAADAAKAEEKADQMFSGVIVKVVPCPPDPVDDQIREESDPCPNYRTNRSRRFAELQKRVPVA